MQNITRKTFDSLILGIDMPDMDGPEVLQRIRERDARMAVIMVTGVRVPRSAPCRLSAWERKYILKPFDPTELEHVIEYGLACAMIATHGTEDITPRFQQEEMGMIRILLRPVMFFKD